MDQKLEAMPLFEGDLGPHPTQCGRSRGLPARQVSSWSVHNTPTSQTDRTWQIDRLRTDNGPIAQGEPFHKRSPNELRSLTTDILTTFSSLDSHIGLFIVGLFFILADIFQSILVSSECTSTSRHLYTVLDRSMKRARWIDAAWVMQLGYWPFSRMRHIVCATSMGVCATMEQPLPQCWSTNRAPSLI